MPANPDETMSTIRDSLERVVSVVERRPSFALDTGRSVSTITDGLKCSSEEGPWRLETDMPESMGGGGTAPTPGVLGRAALGSCLAIGYMMRAAILGVEIISLRVEVEADFDNRGSLILSSEAPPGYTEVRIHVDVESPAQEHSVRQVLDEGDQLSPYLDVFSQAQSVTRTDTIRLSEG